ncbi:hypothetical protein [Nonomuraea sp. NPDC003804]|uniref:hypothetical protein n=1 Tax=Nonomuraea sp. NPDC003804 TaxID=3154547 RepID=UPI0033B34526
MELSQRERRILIEIELGLQRDRRYAHLFDVLDASPRLGPQRFACQVSTTELAVVVVVALALAVLPMLAVLAL